MEAYPLQLETAATLAPLAPSEDARWDFARPNALPADPPPADPPAALSPPARGRARARILRLIREEPGIHNRSIARSLALSRGTTSYHLHLLERRGIVVADPAGRYRRYFAASDPRIHHKAAIHLLRHPTARAIAELVAARPGLIQKDLCQALGLLPSRASWHLRRLEQAQVVAARRTGQRVHYRAGPAWEEAERALPGRPSVPAIASLATGPAAA